MNNDDYDYSDVVDEIPTNLMNVMMQLADQQQEWEQKIERLNEELEKAKDNYREVTENQIPNALDGLEGKFALTDGRSIEVGQKIRASIAGEKKIPAIAWLDANGYGHIVKRVIAVEFKRDRQEEFDKFLDYLNKYPHPVNVKLDYSVHHMTLEAWVREMLGEGVDLPGDVFGIYRQRFSKVK